MIQKIPILDAERMQEIEKEAYSKGIKEEDLMEKAGEGIAQAALSLIAELHLRPSIVLLVGRGNNGGDALVAGRYLIEGGFHVWALALSPKDQSSRLSLLQMERFEKAGGKITFVRDESEIDFSNAELIIDGIFGTGFHGNVEGFFRVAIEKANASKKAILAIDIPSGIHGTHGYFQNTAIIAKKTCFLGFAKIGCFLGEAWNYTGAIQIIDIGIPSYLTSEITSSFYLPVEKNLALPPLIRNRHKYEAGYVIGIGGQLSGASLLAALAALKSGAGITRLYYPEKEKISYSRAPLEIILEAYKSESLEKELKRARALFIGPGLGLDEESNRLLRDIVEQVNLSMVIDGDALTHLSKGNIPYPKNSILTPHIGEMKRLLGISKEIEMKDLLELSRNFAKEKGLTIVLKGSPTFIFSKIGECFLMVRGAPGMATAGSGDVLTGILAALLAQKKEPLEASILGTLLHALSGEIAAKKTCDYSLIASDLIENLHSSFQYLTDKIDTTQETSPSPVLVSI